MTAKMSQLESTIKLLQATIKQQQEVINKLTTAQQQAPTTWSFGATPQPATFTALGAKPAGQSPTPPSPPLPVTTKAKPPPPKVRRRAAIIDSDNEEDGPTTMNEDAAETDSTAGRPADDGINYAIRIRQINKRLDKHDREIRTLNEKVTRIDERVGRLDVRLEKGFAELRQEMSEMKNSIVEELKQFMMGWMNAAGQGTQTPPEASPRHG